VKRYDGYTEVRLEVNGEQYQVHLDPGDTLLQVLRDRLGFTGTKLGCENGDCGACTVLLDGRPAKSCYTLAVDVDDRSITTIEGLRDTPVQRAFAEEYAFQCGYCTPGFVVNAHALLQHETAGDTAVQREWLESNLCRCTGYETIERAIRKAVGPR